MVVLIYNFRQLLIGVIAFESQISSCLKANVIFFLDILQWIMKLPHYHHFLIFQKDEYDFAIR